MRSRPGSPSEPQPTPPCPGVPGFGNDEWSKSETSDLDWGEDGSRGIGPLLDPRDRNPLARRRSATPTPDQVRGRPRDQVRGRLPDQVRGRLFPFGEAVKSPVTAPPSPPAWCASASPSA